MKQIAVDDSTHVLLIECTALARKHKAKVAPEVRGLIKRYQVTDLALRALRARLRRLDSAGGDEPPQEPTNA